MKPEAFGPATVLDPGPLSAVWTSPRGRFLPVYLHNSGMMSSFQSTRGRARCSCTPGLGSRRVRAPAPPSSLVQMRRVMRVSRPVALLVAWFPPASRWGDE